MPFGIIAPYMQNSHLGLLFANMGINKNINLKFIQHWKMGEMFQHYLHIER